MRKVLMVISLVCAGMCLLLAGTSAEAAQWKVFVKDAEGCPQYYDAKGVSKKGAVVKVWTKVTVEGHSECKSALAVAGQPETHRAREMQSLYEVDCAKKRFRMVSTKVYDVSRMLIVDEKNQKATWEPFAPDTVIENLAKTVCK